jgi:hypothetical protein
MIVAAARRQKTGAAANRGKPFELLGSLFGICTKEAETSQRRNVHRRESTVVVRV